MTGSMLTTVQLVYYACEFDCTHFLVFLVAATLMWEGGRGGRGPGTLEGSNLQLPASPFVNVSSPIFVLSRLFRLQNMTQCCVFFPISPTFHDLAGATRDVIKKIRKKKST